MLGVILIILGILSLAKKEKCVMTSAAFTLYLIHVGAWEYLLSSSASYMTLVWALDSKVMIIYPILSVTAAIFTVALLVVIFLPQADKKSK